MYQSVQELNFRFWCCMLTSKMERQNTSFAPSKDDIQTYLVDSGLPISFWGDALHTASYICCRLPMSMLPNGKTSYEAMHSKSLTYHISEDGGANVLWQSHLNSGPIWPKGLWRHICWIPGKTKGLAWMWPLWEVSLLMWHWIQWTPTWPAEHASSLISLKLNTPKDNNFTTSQYPQHPQCTGKTHTKDGRSEPKDQCQLHPTMPYNQMKPWLQFAALFLAETITADLDNLKSFKSIVNSFPWTMLSYHTSRDSLLTHKTSLSLHWHTRKLWFALIMHCGESWLMLNTKI